MWLFMIICYLFTGFSFFLLLLTGIQGYLEFSVFGLNHPSLALLTAIIYLFAETLIIFYFVGSSSSIKEYIKEGLADLKLHQQSKIIIRKLFPSTMLNILLVMVVFITGCAVDTNILPSWLHGLIFFLVVVQFLIMGKIQNSCFRENMDIMIRIAESNNRNNPSQN